MNFNLPPQHELRQLLNDELHSHPYEPLAPPERIVFLAVVVNADERAREAAHLQALLDGHEDALVESNTNRTRYDFGGFRLKVERHVGFTRYKFVWRPGHVMDDTLLASGIGDLLPTGWLAAIPGKLLTALNIALLQYPENEACESLIERYGPLFDANRFSASQVGRSGGLVMTDFSIQEGGFIPMLVFTRAERPAQNGRLILRLIELDAYRALAMLSLPAAREILCALPRLESELATLTEEVALGNRESDESLLERLTSIAARVERMMAASGPQLAASAAYFRLVSQRLKDLREVPLPQVPPMGGLLERRTEPARTTCESAAFQLEQLSHRVAHASQLLRTRIDVHREIQNQSLLVSLNDRFRSQLRLQETAELLSFVVVPYYGVNLLAYLFEELNTLVGLNIEPHMVKALGVPFFIGLMLILLHRIHRANGSKESHSD